VFVVVMMMMLILLVRFAMRSTVAARAFVIMMTMMFTYFDGFAGTGALFMMTGGNGNFCGL